MPLGKRTDFADARFVGCAVGSPMFVEDAEPPLKEALLAGFDFILSPITRHDYRPSASQNDPPLSKGDVLYLSNTRHITQIVGCVSSWIEPDSDYLTVRSQSMAALKSELSWAAHLNLQAVLLPPIPPTSKSCANYSHGSHAALNSLSNMALWLTVPLGAYIDEDDSSWDRWNTFRTQTDFHNLLGCALLVGRDLPPLKLIERWSGEPVKSVLLPTHVFGSNKRGYPILTKGHQEAVQAFFRMGVQIVVTGDRVHEIKENDGPALPAPSPVIPSSHPPGLTLANFLPPTITDPPLGFTINNPGDNHELKSYHDYLSYLFRKMDAVDDQDRLESDYRDYLQAPLQPLQDNLESSTYEVFEKDVTKYTQYEEAIYHALIDRVPLGLNETPEDVTTLMVVGAGRGPLIRSAMKASHRSGRKVAIWAVEKNPNAILHIQTLLRDEGWEDLVTLIFADMRDWRAPNDVKADILVSELLGSFGDNELSPECLDGCTRFLKPDAISIPQSYTSFLAPVTSHKLYNTVKDYKDLEHFETPYVVKFHRHTLFSQTLPVFRFDHPNWDHSVDNTRYVKLSWPRSKDDGAGVIHGFAGYFECVLYKQVTLNIHPPTRTPNMFSWFPIFFPLREPVYVPAGQTIEAHFWRCCGKQKVWYEWSLSAPSPGPVHNIGGRSYFVGL